MPGPQVAPTLLGLALARPPTLGGGRLVCVDGPAGSGKTTLAQALAEVAAKAGSVRVLHMDDMYEGWTGIGEVAVRVDRQILAPLAEGRPGRYRRYDWQRERFAEWHEVDPVDLLVLEGVGSGAHQYAGAVTLLVWVEAPREVRLARGLARDGERMRSHWLRWAEDEQALFAREGTRSRADVCVDGSGAEPELAC